MFKLTLWLINVAIAFILVLFLLNSYLNIDVRSSPLLFIFMLGWSAYGRFIGQKHGYNSILSSWYTPFISFDINFLCVALLTLTALGSLTITKLVAWDLSWAIIPTIPIMLVMLTILPFIRGIPYLRTIALFSTLQTLMIMALVVFIFKIDNSTEPLFTPKTLVNLILIIISYIMISLITCINIFALRGFELYQEMSTNQNLTSKLPHKIKMKIAVHEASHAIMYSFFNKTPESFNIYLYEKAMNIEKGLLGLVTARIPEFKDKNYKEWKMMLAIAGIRGELLVYGSHSQGSASDFEKWQEQAVVFLGENFHNYTPQPTSAAQMQVNKNLEAALFAKHTKIVDAFLKKNKSIVVAIAKQAMVFHSLESHHLQKHLSKVVYTSNFPREKKGFF